MATATADTTTTFIVTLNQNEADQLTTILSRYDTTLDDLYRRLADLGACDHLWEEGDEVGGLVNLVLIK